MSVDDGENDYNVTNFIVGVHNQWVGTGWGSEVVDWWSALGADLITAPSNSKCLCFESISDLGKTKIFEMRTIFKNIFIIQIYLYRKKLGKYFKESVGTNTASLFHTSPRVKKKILEIICKKFSIGPIS